MLKTGRAIPIEFFFTLFSLFICVSFLFCTICDIFIISIFVNYKTIHNVYIFQLSISINVNRVLVLFYNDIEL